MICLGDYVSKVTPVMVHAEPGHITCTLLGPAVVGRSVHGHD